MVKYKTIKKTCTHKIITDENTGELICSKCGRVMAENQVMQKKRRIFYDDDFAKQRTGPPSSLRIADMGMSTTMSYGDYKGHRISSVDQKRLRRLRFWDARIKSGRSSARSLKKGLLQIETLRGKLSLPDSVAEHAAKILRDAQKQKLAVGRNMMLLSVASLYAACRADNVPRNVTEVAREANVNRKSLSKMYRDLASKLDLHSEPFDPASFIGKIASKLNIDARTQRDAIKLLHKASDTGLAAGKRPAAMAAASLYLACIRNDVKTSQAKVSEVSRISQPTIKKICRLLAKIKK